MAGCPKPEQPVLESMTVKVAPVPVLPESMTVSGTCASATTREASGNSFDC